MFFSPEVDSLLTLNKNTDSVYRMEDTLMCVYDRSNYILVTSSLKMISSMLKGLSTLDHAFVLEKFPDDEQITKCPTPVVYGRTQKKSVKFSRSNTTGEVRHYILYFLLKSIGCLNNALTFKVFQSKRHTLKLFSALANR